jgi:hypothetical protein
MSSTTSRKSKRNNTINHRIKFMLRKKNPLNLKS